MAGPLILMLATGFAVAFFHAALPTHWLPFVLVGRAQGWSTPRTLVVTALAGAAHVLVTLALGAVVAVAGVTLTRFTGEGARWVAAGLLFALGVWYLARHCATAQRLAGPNAVVAGEGRRYGSDAAAIGALVLMLTLSPCEAFLPVFLSAAPYGVAAFLLLCLTFTLATAAGMTVFTTAFAFGWERLKLQALERYDRLILGAALCLLGVAVLVLER